MSRGQVGADRLEHELDQSLDASRVYCALDELTARARQALIDRLGGGRSGLVQRSGDMATETEP